MYLTQLSLFTAGQEKENQERNKDPGESEGWPKYHLTVRYRQGSCGNFVLLVLDCNYLELVLGLMHKHTCTFFLFFLSVPNPCSGL